MSTQLSEDDDDLPFELMDLLVYVVCFASGFAFAWALQ